MENIFWNDKMLVAFTYRPCKGFKDTEKEKVLDYVEKGEFAYVFEGQGDDEHIHGVIVKNRDRNAVTNIGLALRNIAKKFDTNVPKVTVCVKTAYKGAYKEEVGSNYGNYLEYMCKGLTTKLVSNLPEEWEEYLTDDIAPEDRRVHDADEKLAKCIALLNENITPDDPPNMLKSVAGVAVKIHELSHQGKWKQGRNFSENDYFATMVHSRINKTDYFDAKDNYRRLLDCNKIFRHAGWRRKNEILKHFQEQQGEGIEDHGVPWNQVLEDRKGWSEKDNTKDKYGMDKVS